MLASFARDYLDLIFPPLPLAGPEPERIRPPFCGRCGSPIEGAAPANPASCAHCRSEKWKFAFSRAAYRARGRVREGVHGFKYEGRFWLRRQLVDWLADGWADHFARDAAAWDALVPVPLHHLRHRERGFNQARVLAEGLSAACGVPVWNGLRRVRPTSKQSLLDRRHRLTNLRQAFALSRPFPGLFRPPFELRGKSLVLIDDVFTTGATADACARVLLRAGAKRVAVLTVARG